MVKPTNVYTVVFVVVLSIFFLEFLNSKKPRHPDAGLNIAGILEKYEYPLETHEVVTEDGYILTLHRIPHGRRNTHKNGIPILFMHGLMHSGVDFVILGPDKALALLLAEQGFDIWLGNARGTTWSRKHKTLDPDRDREYWDFSIHEIGAFDVPAFIDHILRVTGHDGLHYVGYSQGTITFFMMTSERPEYAHKVKLATMLTPAIFLNNSRSFFLNFSAFIRDAIDLWFKVFDVPEFFANDSIFAFYLNTICNENSIFVNLCLFHVYNVHGFNFEGGNKTLLSLIYTNTPAGISSNQLIHILQLIGTGNMQKYDMGTEGNLKKYGQKEPPMYDLSKATTPVALYYSSNDWTVNIKNIERVEKSLPNVVKSYQVPSEKFNHDDFVHSNDAPEKVYKSVIEEIIKYS